MENRLISFTQDAIQITIALSVIIGFVVMCKNRNPFRGVLTAAGVFAGLRGIGEVFLPFPIVFWRDNSVLSDMGMDMIYETYGLNYVLCAVCAIIMAVCLCMLSKTWVRASIKAIVPVAITLILLYVERICTSKEMWCRIDYGAYGIIFGGIVLGMVIGQLVPAMKKCKGICASKVKKRELA